MNAQSHHTQRPARAFPLVCIGGSAGGLEAYMKVLKSLPADLGAAIVIVNHMTRVPTRLHHVLSRHTRLPVELIYDGQTIRPNCVYIIPHARELHICRNHEFRLQPRTKTYGWPDVITRFLRSTAANWEGQVIAVIVSGLDHDGVEALGDLKSVGAITFAQRPDTAEWPDMPVSAIQSGSIDYIRSPEEIGRAVTRVVRGAAQQHA